MLVLLAEIVFKIICFICERQRNILFTFALAFVTFPPSSGEKPSALIHFIIQTTLRRSMYLNAHSFFSLRYGTLSPQQLVEAAAAQGVKTLVLTDINNTSAALGFVRACKSPRALTTP